MKSYQLVQLLVLSLFFNVLSAQATSLDTSLMAGDFLKDNKILEGRWFGGKNFTGNLCRSFYSFRVGARGYVDKVEMNLGADNEMDVYGSLSNAHAKVEGEYLGDYSACQNATGWLGIGVDKIEVRSKVHVPEDSVSPLTVKVYYLKLGGVHLGKYAPEWFEKFVGNSLNSSFAYIWQTCLGNWMNQYLSDYINSLKPQRGL